MVKIKTEYDKIVVKIANEVIDQLEKDIKEENLYALWQLIEHIPLNKQVAYLEEGIGKKLKHQLFMAKYPTNTTGLTDDLYNVVKNSLKLKANNYEN